jgi:hypothetical protein
LFSELSLASESVSSGNGRQPGQVQEPSLHLHYSSEGSPCEKLLAAPIDDNLETGFSYALSLTVFLFVNSDMLKYSCFDEIVIC